MHLQVSIVLLFILLNGGFSLDCYEGYSQQEGPCENQTCDEERSKCRSMRTVEYDGDSMIEQETTVTSCARPDECESWSFSTGYKREASSVQCCDTDFCNDQAAPDLFSYYNGKRCFTCDLEGCSYILNCRWNEDYCFSAKENEYEYDSLTIKGCASKYICYDGPIWLGPSDNILCCEGNLCNGAQSVTQSFLFLCCSLLSYFLLF